jgi:transcriptional regulator of acetoin/glycerol metabolism
MPQPRTSMPHASLAESLRDDIRQSHARCMANGLSPTATPELSPGPPSLLREARERHRRLYEQAAPVMEMLSAQIVYTRSIVALTDANGTILHAVGDNGFLERAQQVALAPGVNWAEAAKGTNAIGTALFNESPTLVHATEHYVRANQFLTCSAAPIFDHAGQLLGVLDVSGDQRSYHAHTLAMVSMSARMIENQWINDRFRDGLRLYFHRQPEMLGTMREGMLALSPDGAILGANRSAIELLGLNVAALRMLGMDAVFGIGVAAIADHFRRGSDTPMLLRPTVGAAGGPLHARAQFNWPTLWPAQSAASEQRPTAASTGETPSSLQALEVEAVRRAVEASGGNISRAARQLGVGRNTVYRKLRSARR